MNINRENYEIWAIDYLEGKLNTSESAEFMLFLAENSDLEVELDTIRDFTLPELVAEPINNFSLLKKNFSDTAICTDNFEEFCIAFYEKELDDIQTKQLKDFVKASPKRQYVFETYGKTYFQADLSVLFDGKKQLKKTKQFTLIYRPKIAYATIAVAASIILLLTFSFLLRNNSTPQKMIASDSEELSKPATQKVYTKPKQTTELISEAVVANKTSTFASPSHVVPESISIPAANVLDTNEMPDVFIPAARLNIALLPTSTEENYIVLNQSLQAYHTPPDKSSQRLLQSIEQSGHNAFTSLKNINLDLVLRKSVDGINQVAETELQYNSETDDEGRIIAFALSTDRFNIRKKFRN